MLLCQSGIGAAPIDKYPTAPGTASRYCTLFLGVVALVVACSPCSRSKSNLTPAAYHLTVQTVRMGYQVDIFSRLAAPRSPTRIGRHVQRQIGSDQDVRSPSPDRVQQRVSRGPWSTNAEEMTLWICSAARNEGKMAERVPRTMHPGLRWEYRSHGPSTCCSPAAALVLSGKVPWCIPVGGHWRIDWE